MFYHSALSDWNHGNAHFLRGVASELVSRGHDVLIYEPQDSWSFRNLLEERGDTAISRFRQIYPHLKIVRYASDSLDLNDTLAGADLVLVHEWNEPALIARIGCHRGSYNRYNLFFHDTHHRSVTDPSAMSLYGLSQFDGVLVYGESIRRVYLQNSWSNNVQVWHEAADTRVFHPQPKSVSNGECGTPNGHGNHNSYANRSGRNAHNGASAGRVNSTIDESAPSGYLGDIVWIGNWGDNERAAEIHEYLIQPVRELGLKARVYGVRYPQSAIRELTSAGIEYAGWLPNFDVPGIFARFRVTVHIPRRPYVRSLPGIPTIRPFEALACKIPLVSAYWNDCEGLFTPGEDFLVARDGVEMKTHLHAILRGPNFAAQIAENGYRTILARHTCAHRVDELLRIHREALAARELCHER